MNIQPDFEELLRLLEEHKVEYLIVGGFAVAYHGYPRFTKDIDIFFRGTGENIQKLRRALIEFGFADNELPQDLFQKDDLPMAWQPSIEHCHVRNRARPRRHDERYRRDRFSNRLDKQATREVWKNRSQFHRSKRINQK